MILNSFNYNLAFGEKNNSPRKDVSNKIKIKSEKMLETRLLRNFIDDLQLIPEENRVYYSDRMMSAKFRPRNWKKFVPKILKIV